MRALLQVGLRWPGLALALVAALSAAATAVLAAPRAVGAALGRDVSLRLDASLESLFPARDPRLATLEDMRRDFGRDDRDVVLLLELAPGAHALDPATLARVASLTRTLQGLPHVDAEGVVSLTRVTYPRSRDDELRLEPLYEPGGAADPAELAGVPAHPIYRDRVVSADGRRVGFVVPLHPLDDQPAARAAFAAALLALAPGPGEALWVDGPIVARARIQALMRQDMRTVYPAALLVLVVVLALWLRDPVACLLALGVVVLTGLWTLAGMALCGVPLNPLSTAIPVLLLVSGVGDAVHLLGRLRQRLAAGEASAEALRATVDEVGLACLCTSLTTAAGFGALALGDVRMLADLGAPVALGVLAAFALTLLLLPPCLRGPRWVRWAARGAPAAAGGDLGDRVARRLWLLVDRRRGALLASWALLTLLAALTLPWLRVETRMLGDFGPESILARTRAAFEERFGGVSALEVVVRAPEVAVRAPEVAVAPAPERAASVDPWLEDDFGDGGLEAPPARLLEPEVQAALAEAVAALRGPELRAQGVLTVHALPDYLVDMNHVLHDRAPGTRRLPGTRAAAAQFLLFYEGARPRDPTAALLAGHLRALRLSVRVQNLTTGPFFALARAVREEVARRLPADLRVEVTGNTLMIQAAHESLVANLVRGLGAALLAVVVAVLAVARSARLALLALLPNLIPLLFGLALLAVSGVALRLATSAIFCVVFGIAVDDTIHFLAALRARADLPERERVRAALLETGHAIVGTTAILAGGFGVLLLSAVQANRLFGLLCATTLVVALLCDLLLLPALLLLRRAPEGDG